MSRGNGDIAENMPFDVDIGCGNSFGRLSANGQAANAVVRWQDR